jgi:hypothetical protein
MAEKNYEYEADRPDEDKHEVVISDLRHTRSLEEIEKMPEPPAEKPAEAPAPAAEAPPEKPAPAAPPAPEAVASAAEIEEEIGRPEAEHQHAHEGQMSEEEAAFEMEQLRMIFGAGLTAYLHNQLGMLLNFSMIHLGRAPNPATGIVSTDLDKARIAIDTMEFIVSRIQAELPPDERAGAIKLIGELKYVYMQMVSAGSVIPPGTPPQA